MNFSKTMFSAAIAIALFTSCKQNSQDVGTVAGSGVLLKWNLLGPFPAGDNQNYFYEDNLKIWGYDESTITYDEIKGISKNSSILDYDFHEDFVNEEYLSPTRIINFNKKFKYGSFWNAITANIYASCIIVSDKPKEVYLNFSCDDYAKVYLNHEEIIHVERIGSVSSHEKFVPIKLKEGENFLLVKVFNSLYDWQMYVKLEPEKEPGYQRHKKLMARVNNGKFFNYCVLDSVCSLEPSDVLPNIDLPFNIKGSNGKIVYYDTVSSSSRKREYDLSFLEDGLYTSTMQIFGDSIKQYLFKGNILDSMANLIKELESIDVEDVDISNNIEANIYRYNHLLKSRNSSYVSEKEWQRKVLKQFIELNTSYGKLMQDLHPDRNSPGTHIRTYVSKIDGGVQYYIVHVPTNIKEGEKLPLALYMPAKLGYHPPYLESMRVADIKLNDNLQSMSNRYNMIVLQPFCREVGKLHFNSIEDSDVFEAMESVRKNYLVDTSRIYITGTCEGGYKAIRFASRYPSVITAIGLIAPLVHQGFSDQQYYVQNAPESYFLNLKNTPVLIVHSELDRHSSVVGSDYLAQFAEQSSFGNFNYKRLNDEVNTYYWYDYSDDVFSFFNETPKKEIPKEFEFITNQLKYKKAYWVEVTCINPMQMSNIEVRAKAFRNTISVNTENMCGYILDLKAAPVDHNKPVRIIENGALVEKTRAGTKKYEKPFDKGNGLVKNHQVEGPFTHIFNNSFIVVIGKSGTKEENSINAALADTIKKSWRYKFQNPCKVKFDNEIDSGDIKNSNLLLLGNFNSNSYLKKIQERLPLSISIDEVKIGNKNVEGDSLGFYMVYPNPDNPGKYIGIIGYNSTVKNYIGKPDMAEEEYEHLMDYQRREDYFYDLTCYGWYDYKIWKSDGEPIVSGYFDFFWGD